MRVRRQYTRHFQSSHCKESLYLDCEVLKKPSEPLDVVDGEAEKETLGRDVVVVDVEHNPNWSWRFPKAIVAAHHHVHEEVARVVVHHEVFHSHLRVDPEQGAEEATGRVGAQPKSHAGRVRSAASAEENRKSEANASTHGSRAVVSVLGTSTCSAYHDTKSFVRAAPRCREGKIFDLRPRDSVDAGGPGPTTIHGRPLRARSVLT